MNNMAIGICEITRPAEWQIERRDIAIAIQLQHADSHGKIGFAVQENQGEHEFLPDRNKVQSVADNNSCAESGKMTL